MKKIIFRLLFLFSLSLSFANLHAGYDVATDFKLNNGLQVVCINKKTLPIVCFSVFYKCGSVNEKPSKSGVAHYLEHMAFCGDKGIFSNFLESIGAQYNAFTSFRCICFYEIVPVVHLEKVFQYEARRMEFMDIDREKFISEKGAILEERSMRTDNTPFGQLSEVFVANLFNRRLGGIMPIGWRHEIENTEPKDIIEFHDKWFAPNNAIVLIVGDIDVERVKFLAQKYFGKIQAKEVEKLAVCGNRPKEFRKIEVRSPKIGSAAMVICSYFVPFSVKENFRKVIALSLASAALNQPTAFVKKTLEHTLNIAGEVSFEYDTGAFQYDTFQINILCSSINNLSDAEKLMPYLKDKILTKGISQFELDNVKRQFAISKAHRDDDIETVSQHIWYNWAAGFSTEQVLNMDDIIQSITVKECCDALNEVLNSSPIAISRVLPKEQDRD